MKSDLYGGAIIIQPGNRLDLQNYIDNCFFSECESQRGGAIYIEIRNFVTTNIFNSEFKQNLAYRSGGAIYAFSRTSNNFSMRNCTFDANSAIDLGGSISFSRINISFEECRFNKNRINNYRINKGGAIYSTHSNISLTKCIFNTNSIYSNFSRGGAISINSHSNLSLFECTFKNNTVISEQNGVYGGAISLWNSIILCKKSSFINNLACSNCLKSKNRCDGGAISFVYSMKDNENLFESFIECSFINNTAYSKYCVSSGGAISYFKSFRYQKIISFTSNEFFQNLTFQNNTAYSEKYTSYGGAIVYEVFIFYPYQNVVQNRLFEYLNCINNTAFSKSSSSQGGAICYLFYVPDSCITKQNGTLNKSTFINNTAMSSDSNSFGGALFIQSHYYNSNAIEYFNNNIYNNNIALSCGGSIYISKSKGIFQNCTFNNNIVMIYGGCVFMDNSDFCFIECAFQNNTGNGNSYTRGGAIFSSQSILNLNKNNFINNTLCPKNKLKIIYYVEGAACYFNNSEVHVSDCDFVNNSIKVMKSIVYNICGGAIYSDTSEKSFICTNCSFINNTVYVSYKKNEFGGAVYLTNGKLNNCTFIDNKAYNGCDIKYDQINNSNLCITGCIFDHNKIKKKIDIRSIIHFNVINNNLFTNEFSNNRILNNNLLYLYGGEYKLISTPIKFNFKNNCIYPFNGKFFKNGKFVFYNENEGKISFNSAFNSVCSAFDNQHVDSKKNNNKNPRIFILLCCIMTLHIIFVLLLVVWIVLKVTRNGNKDDFTGPLIDIDIPSYLI